MFYIDQANQVECTKPLNPHAVPLIAKMTRRVGFAWNKDELYGKSSYYMPCYSAINDQSLLSLHLVDECPPSFSLHEQLQGDWSQDK